MEKILRLYKYIDGINDMPFPSTDNQLDIIDFRYDAQRMGGAPTISGTIMNKECLDKVWDDNVYVVFNGEKYFIKQTPTSSYSNEDTRYKHECEFISERYILDNVYFIDAVTDGEDGNKPVSNNTQFTFYGTVHEFANRIGHAMEKANINYTITVDDGITSEAKLVSFEDAVFSEALQEIYNIYEIPYYFNGHVIHVGFTDNAITETFKYGVENSLLSINKTNANYKIVTRVSGHGSETNIPYYYPNATENGDVQVLYNDASGIVSIENISKFKELKKGDKLIYVKKASFTANLFSHWSAVRLAKTADANGYYPSQWTVTANYYFNVSQYGYIDVTISCNQDDSPSPISGTLREVGVNKILATFSSGTTIKELSDGEYYITLRATIYHEDTITAMSGVDLAEYVFNVSTKQNFIGFAGWMLNDVNSSRSIQLSEYGLSIGDIIPKDGDVISVSVVRYIMPQPYLMPSIYRETGGNERFYNAINQKYINPDTAGYYVFNNLYISGKQKEHYVTFDDIQPTIKGMTNASGQAIDEIADVAFDNGDNDEFDDDGNYLHPYFYVKLNKMDGAYGFNMFEHAISGNDMVISMTSGACGACEFTVMVDEQSMKNIVQVDENGYLKRDDDGNVLFGTPQDRQNDTSKNSVWIALKKDIDTFGVIMPNAAHQYKPAQHDKFVILHIELPNSYILAAEKRLEEALIKYMKMNNDEKFTFTISFSRIYFAEHPDILAMLNENARIQLEYDNTQYELYVSSYSYNMSGDHPLPEIKVELSDTLTVSKNALQTSIDKVKSDIMSTVGSIDWLKLGLGYFLRKDQRDRTRYMLSSDKGFEVGNFVSGSKGAMMYIDELTSQSVLEVDKIYARVKAIFEELEIVDVNTVGGKQIISPGGGVRITSVIDRKVSVDESGNETEDIWNFYRCYFTTEQDGDKVENTFHIGDLAYCRNFNVLETSKNGGSRYYWRYVLDIGQDYIDLSKSDCDTGSDEPMAGDVICQRGNRDDVDRQNFIEFSSVDAFSPSITLYQGVNDYTLADKDVISYGVDKTTGKAFMNVYGDMYIGNRDGSSYVKYSPEKGVEINGTLNVGTKFGDKSLGDVIDEAGNAYKEPLSELENAIKGITDDLQSQIDGAIVSWFYDPEPTLTNAPAKDWTTDEEKNNHLGDLYYSGKGRAYRFQLNADTGVYYWNEIIDNDIILALENAKKAQDTADGKRRIFAVQPTDADAYDVGDMWVNATYPADGSTYKNDMLRAQVSKKAGEPFRIEHWTLASKYTDDTAANEAKSAVAEAKASINILEGTVKNMREFTDEAFRDGIIDRSESIAISQLLNEMETAHAYVAESYDKVHGNSLIDSVISQGLDDAHEAFIAAYNEFKSAVESAISDGLVDSNEKATVDGKYKAFNLKYSDYIGALNAANKSIQDNINRKATAAITDIGGYEYLKKALANGTDINGGLIQTTLASFGYKAEDGTYKVMSGTSGIYDASRKGGGVAFWAGGGNIDKFDNVSGGTPAKFIVRHDGTGYMAGGAIKFFADGKIEADPLSFFVGESTVGNSLALFQYIGTDLDGDGQLEFNEVDYVIPQKMFQKLDLSEIGLHIGSEETGRRIYVKDGVLYIDGDLAVTGGITMFAQGSKSVSSIMDAIVCDNTTIQVVNGVLTVIGGTGGIDEEQLAAYLTANSYAKTSDITAALVGYAKTSDVPVKVSELTDDIGLLNDEDGKVIAESISTAMNRASDAMTASNELKGYVDGVFRVDDSGNTIFNNTIYGSLYGNASSATNADMLDGYHASYGSNKPWGTIPVITTSGWMDVGRQFEFHYDNTTGSDFSAVLVCTGNHRNVVSLPSTSGTLALLTDNVASATKLQTARTISLTGSVTGSVSFDGSGDVSIATATNHSHTFAAITDKPTTVAGYGITDAMTSKFIVWKEDYQRYVILLCKIGTNTTNIDHTINGTFWTRKEGSARYQAAHINVHCSDWSQSHNEYYGFTPFGIGTKCRLVTCTYQASQYLAVTFDNIMSCSIIFDGSYYNILFTPILYYTSKTSTINNAEIYNSISEVQYNKIPIISSAATSSHFIKGDGSLDSNTYALASSLTNYLPLNGGTLDGDITINTASERKILLTGNNTEATIAFALSDVTMGNVGYKLGVGAYIYNASANKFANITDAGVLQFGGNTVLDSSNYSSYALPLSGGTMSNTNLVTNLNADLLDGYHASSFSLNGHTHPYLPLSGGTMTGPIKFSYNNNGNCNVNRTSGFSMFYGNQRDATNYGFPFQYSSVISFMTAYCGMQFANYGGNGNSRLLFRNISDHDTWTPWYTILHSGNYNSYAPTLTGTGASGTWGINISGNAATATALTTSAGNSSTPVYFSSGKPVACTTLALSTTGNAYTATKLQTARTIWGQSFDGTGNVSGSMTGVDGIGMTGILFNNRYNGSGNRGGAFILINKGGNCFGMGASSGNVTSFSFGINNHDGTWINEYLTILDNGNIGIGTTSPSYKLHVDGTTYAYGGFVKGGSSDSYVLLGGGGHKSTDDFLYNEDGNAMASTIATLLDKIGQLKTEIAELKKLWRMDADGNLMTDYQICTSKSVTIFKS